MAGMPSKFFNHARVDPPEPHLGLSGPRFSLWVVT